MVYFARVDVATFKAAFNPIRTVSFIKIGCSVHPVIRMVDLRSEYGKPVTLLAAIRGGFRMEAAMHKRFDHLRIAAGRERNGSGLEWFHPTDELMEFITNIRGRVLTQS